MKIARLVSLAVLLASAPALAEKTENSPPDNAFLFEARLALGSALALFAPGGSFAAVPSLLVGGRLVNRLHVGLGFGFTRFTGGGGFGGGGSENNLVSFAPTLAADL